MATERCTEQSVDTVIRLTHDITDADDVTLNRLQSLIATVAEKSPAAKPHSLTSRLTRLKIADEKRLSLHKQLSIDTNIDSAPIYMVRIDEREDLLAARVAGPLTALAGAERLGPFVVDGSRVWFNFYRPTRRFTVTESAASAPAFVLSSARRPVLSASGPLTLDLQAGTVWIRGDLLSASLPTGAYIGIRVSDGKLKLPNTVNIDTGEVEIAAPVNAKLTLQLDPGSVSLSDSGCDANTSLSLPQLTLTWDGGHPAIEMSDGEVEVWGHTYHFPQADGSMEFIQPLWTFLLGARFEPQTFAAESIHSDLLQCKDSANVTYAGLSLPVVVANPAILGETQIAPGWCLALEQLQARWYVPDDRYHRMDAWMNILTSGVSLFANSVTAYDQAVSMDYRLWSLPQTTEQQTTEQRLPWWHIYDKSFVFYYRCDLTRGEDLITTGSSKLVLDRPVRTNGVAIATPTSISAMHQYKPADGDHHITLAAMVSDDAPENRLALRNALCWTTRAVLVLAQGTLIEQKNVDQGQLYTLFGVYAWAPTLPDPYVGNFQVCRPDIDRPRGILAAAVKWSTPTEANTHFTGQLGPPIVCDKPSSGGKPQPLPSRDLNPDTGLTQTEQHTRHLSEKELAEWRKAQDQEKREREKRVIEADQQNQRSLGAIDGYTDKLLGRTPPLFLLDVSTNQDLLGVALWGVKTRRQEATESTTTIPPGATPTAFPAGVANFPVQALDVNTPVEYMRLMTLPQIQWEPVRTLDEDQDVMTLGWFPTPLASATDGGATVLGARWQKLAPVIPDEMLQGTFDAFSQGTEVTFRTTLPFGLVTAATLLPQAQAGRPADLYSLTRPEFPQENALGGIQITAKAEGDRADDGNVSPYFKGLTRQLINGVDLQTGAPLGLSVLSSTGDPMGDVETVFNNDMAANPKVPVTRFDLSGYGGSNFSRWQNTLALFAETAKTQFAVMVGRTALEIIKVASVLHPWGIRVTRSVIVERKPGGGVIRRDTGWQATSPGLLDYRYHTDTGGVQPKVAPYEFDAGIFKGLFNIRAIRPAPGLQFSDGASTTMVPYYFDAELKLEGLHGQSTQAVGLLGWLQTAPNGDPAPASAIRQLIETQGPIGGPIDTWLDFGASRLPFRARRIEIGVADDSGTPVFVATVRGAPKFPKTGAWSVVQRELQGLPPGGGEAVPVAESRGVPIIRRYPVKYAEGDSNNYAEPPLQSGASIGDWRFADAEDLFTPASPRNDYCVLQSTPTHAFLFPRPYAKGTGSARLRSDIKPEFADIIARSTSKGAFPPPENAIQLNSTRHFNVGTDGSLALSSPVSIINHPTPLRLSGAEGHGNEMRYDNATMQMAIEADEWSAEFTGLEVWSDIAGMRSTSGARLRIVGSTTQRSQIASIDTLAQESIEKILTYLPIFGARDPLGPIDLGASNTKHEIKIDVAFDKDVPDGGWSVGNSVIKLSLGVSQSTGFDVTTGGVKASATLSAGLKGEIPVSGIFYIVVQLNVSFTIASVSGSVTAETFDLLAFVGVGVKGSLGPFQAYAYLGIGFVLSYDIINDKPKYGGIVKFEAGIEVVVVKIKLSAELQGLVYKDDVALPPPETGTVEKTMCDYSGKVKLQVDIFLIISISATYAFSGTKELE